jgi:hypothetical protein
MQIFTQLKLAPTEKRTYICKSCANLVQKKCAIQVVQSSRFRSFEFFSYPSVYHNLIEFKNSLIGCQGRQAYRPIKPRWMLTWSWETCDGVTNKPYSTRPNWPNYSTGRKIRTVRPRGKTVYSFITKPFVVTATSGLRKTVTPRGKTIYNSILTPSQNHCWSGTQGHLRSPTVLETVLNTHQWDSSGWSQPVPPTVPGSHL